MPEPVWKCKVDNGKPMIFNREMWRQHLRKLEGKLCELILREPKPHDNYKEDELRKYYFKCVADVIAKDTGNCTHDVHEEMKRKFSSETDEFGITTVHSVFSRKATTDTEKKRFINNVRSWALDWNIKTEPYGWVE